MPRKRMISPTIWEDPSFNRLSIGARLLFIGMISNADDEGYLRGNSGSLKRLVFGFDEAIMPELVHWIDELKKMKNIHFYNVDDEGYVHFLKWDQYQKQKKDRIQKSAYPLCPICNGGQVPDICPASDRQLPAEVKLSKDKISKEKESKKEKEITPKEFTELFFNQVESLQRNDSAPELVGLIEKMSEKYNVPKGLVWAEIQKFASYWTELNGTGRKQRWQMQKTFEANRRLATWFGNVGNFSRSRGKNIIT